MQVNPTSFEGLFVLEPKVFSLIKSDKTFFEKEIEVSLIPCFIKSSFACDDSNSINVRASSIFSIFFSK